jgi:TolB protein
MSMTIRVNGAILLAALVLASTSATAGQRLQATGEATLFMPDIVSTPYSEVRLAISPDGRTLLWGSTDRPGGPGGWDIWMVRREGPGWSKPEPVPFDTPAHEFDPAFDHDGRYVYFFSNRPGGFGGDDIYRVSFDAKTARFGKAGNLGASINTTGDEWAPSPSPDGKHLLFASNGYACATRHDLFVATLRDNGTWRTRPLPGEVNSAEDEFDAAFVPGGIVFARSTDVDKAPIALWFAPTSSDDGYGTPVRLDNRINVDGGWTLGPSTDPRHPGILLFSGQRTPNRGKSDIYAIPVRLDP